MSHLSLELFKLRYINDGKIVCLMGELEVVDEKLFKPHEIFSKKI